MKEQKIQHSLHKDSKNRWDTDKICVSNAFSINQKHFKDASFHVKRETKGESMRFHGKGSTMLYLGKKLW